MRPVPLFLFAKAPIAGQVKTRLQSHCSARQAADIAEILLEESLKQVVEHWPGDVLLSVWLDHHHAFIQSMLAKYPIRLTHQCAGDLGTKMQHAFDSVQYPAAIMGSDAPHIRSETLTKAYAAMQRGESVIAPSDDGGYYFIGLSKAAPSLFVGPQWGSESVLACTLNNASESGIVLTKLASLNDVDEWPDLLDAAERLPALKDYLRQTKLISA